jgi:hypothetical protein
MLFGFLLEKARFRLKACLHMGKLLLECVGLPHGCSFSLPNTKSYVANTFSVSTYAQEEVLTALLDKPRLEFRELGLPIVSVMDVSPLPLLLLLLLLGWRRRLFHVIKHSGAARRQEKRRATHVLEVAVAVPSKVRQRRLFQPTQ